MIHGVHEAPRSATDVEKFQIALIAPGQRLARRGQGLAPHRVAPEHHLDPRVVALGGVPVIQPPDWK